MRWLQANGAANLESRDDDGYTPLHRAAEAGQVETMKWLLGAGSPVAAKGQEGHTVVHLAAISGRAAALEVQMNPSY